ncbi:MAG: ferrous iron transporter B [Clostridia bacterium]|nr:ferrous iron transporter B [Clostridia bacterium]
MKTFALAGNPNCGKTTLFNALTGSTAHVGNWPGVTVDKREGVYKGGEKNINIVDLPGIYSLSPYTPEEVISRNYILDEKPDGIINIIDATNLERNLYLTTQLLEMDVPVIIALNMMDEVEKAGDKIDPKAIENALGVPVVAVSALKGTGIKQLMDRAAAMPTERKGSTVLKSALKAQIETACAYYEAEGVSSPLFHAIKLLEKDEIEIERKGAKEVLEKASAGADLEAEIADKRYQYISIDLANAKVKVAKETLTKSDKIDKILTHRIWSIPIFIVILFAIFHLTFSENLFFLNGFTESQGWMPTLFDAVEDGGLGWEENFGTKLLACFYDGTVFSPGVILTNLLNFVLDYISEGVSALIGVCGGAAWVDSLVCDAVLGGIFAVLGFLPQILFLFLGFSILEDTGYMARIAFVLDRIFRRFGLSGRAFMPMIMGFGCSLPAMINTRTLADEKERTATIRVIPFFSCGAKLPILTAMAGGILEVFGVGNVDLITLGMYLAGIIIAICAVLLMRNTTMRGETPPFIMELPAYHWPAFKNLMLHLWDKTKHFVKKAFTIIFASTVIIWVLQSFSWSWEFLLQDAQDLFEADPVKWESLAEIEGLVNVQTDRSILGSLGMLVQPLFTPLGFGSQLGKTFGWVFAVAAITGLVAKENVIATFGALAAVVAGAYIDWEADEVATAVAMIEGTGITIPAIISFIIFNMTTIPCFAACATAKSELPKGKFRWTLLFWVVTSYLSAAAIYTVGSWWWTLFIWLAVIGTVVTFIVLRNIGKFDITKIFKSRKKK